MAAGAGLALGLAAAPAWGAGAPATIQTEGLSISLATTPNPPARHEGTAVEITMQDAAGKPVGGARVSLDLTMPAHHTMSEQGPRVHERGEGRYVATAAFSMGGEWLVIVDVLLANGRRARAEFPLRVR
jgi:nitrogen fixation protein FixH